jgi:1,4-alpha-glucan branching enzyme
MTIKTQGNLPGCPIVSDRSFATGWQAVQGIFSMAKRKTESKTKTPKPARPKSAPKPPRAKPAAKKRVTFALHAPDAQSVLVTGSFCDWNTAAGALKKDKQGLWKKSIMLAPGRYEYRFLVDGAWQDDPQCAERAPNTFGTANCVLTV